MPGGVRVLPTVPTKKKCSVFPVGQLGMAAMRATQKKCLAVVCICAAIVFIAQPACAEPFADQPLDSLSQAVVDSLAEPQRTTAPQLLDAVIRATEVDALATALDYFKLLFNLLDKAGDDRLRLLADLGDTTNSATLNQLNRELGALDPRVSPLLDAMREAAQVRRRDPKRLAQAGAALGGGDRSLRLNAANQLSRAGVDAIPVLVDLLQTDDGVKEPARSIAVGLLQNLGNSARQPLLAWLGSDDLAHWSGVIAALDACEAQDIAIFLVAPSLVAGTPPLAQQQATALLKRRAADQSPAAAIDNLRQRLDQLLLPTGRLSADQLLQSGSGFAAADGADRTLIEPTVDRFLWDGKTKSIQRRALPLAAARALEALHLARDLSALQADDSATVRLVLLAQLEATLTLTPNPLTALEQLKPAQLRDVLTGPVGFDVETVADVLDMAVARGMVQAAAAAARALGQTAATGTDQTAPLPPVVRKALVRALDQPDSGLQFEAARALVLAAGDASYPGTSRVVLTLLSAATATGIDRAVVAHSDPAIAQLLATGVSRFGYQTVRVSTGRDAIFAARQSSDTVLVLLSARITTPTAYETVQLLRRQPAGDIPPVMLVVDPLDDDQNGAFLTRQIMKFSERPAVEIVDRLDSFFQPTRHPQTSAVLAKARFPDALLRVAGPQAVVPAMRQTCLMARLERARKSLWLLNKLSRRGWDLSAATPIATLALTQEELFAPAIALLSTLGSGAAQQAIVAELDRSDLSLDRKTIALTAFRTSVQHFGVLLESGPLLATYTRYNRATNRESREVIGAILDVLETPRTQLTPSTADAPHSRPIR